MYCHYLIHLLHLACKKTAKDSVPDHVEEENLRGWLIPIQLN